MNHAAAEALSSLSRCSKKPVRWPIACSQRPRNSVRGLRLSRPLRLRFRESGAFCASRSLLRDVPREPIGTNTPPPASRTVVGGRGSPVTGCGPRLTGHGSRVTDHRSQVAGHRSPVARLLRLRRVRRRQGQTGQKDESATGTQSTEMFFFSAASASLRCNPSMVLKMKKVSHNPFTMCTCAKTPLQVLCNPQLQIIGLKVPWNEQLQKIPGGRGGTLVANAGLNPHFSLRRPDQGAQFRGSIFVLNYFDLSRSSAASQAGRERTRISQRGRGTGSIRSGWCPVRTKFVRGGQA